MKVSEKAKVVLLDIILDQSLEAQNMVKDMMGEAFEAWLLERLEQQLEQQVAEPKPAETTPTEEAEEVPLPSEE